MYLRFIRDESNQTKMTMTMSFANGFATEELPARTLNDRMSQSLDHYCIRVTRCKLMLLRIAPLNLSMIESCTTENLILRFDSDSLMLRVEELSTSLDYKILKKNMIYYGFDWLAYHFLNKKTFVLPTSAFLYCWRFCKKNGRDLELYVDTREDNGQVKVYYVYNYDMNIVVGELKARILEDDILEPSARDYHFQVQTRENMEMRKAECERAFQNQFWGLKTKIASKKSKHYCGRDEGTELFLKRKRDQQRDNESKTSYKTTNVLDVSMLFERGTKEKQDQQRVSGLSILDHLYVCLLYTSPSPRDQA
eukprot:TRINITY_DN9002_c0_g1_i6.p1 TRINITY_DN9002_c0_g1~~TRINITY_DN9002_c0_g1_i6.p1  ORF type:complete len:308 (-),score=21.09 TRINITY_DN9002_c0_g1_i6:77-1000(-)